MFLMITLLQLMRLLLFSPNSDLQSVTSTLEPSARSARARGYSHGVYLNMHAHRNVLRYAVSEDDIYETTKAAKARIEKTHLSND